MGSVYNYEAHLMLACGGALNDSNAKSKSCWLNDFLLQLKDSTYFSQTMKGDFNQNMLSVICGILAKLNTHKVNIETKIERKKGVFWFKRTILLLFFQLPIKWVAKTRSPDKWSHRNWNVAIAQPVQGVRIWTQDLLIAAVSP